MSLSVERGSSCSIPGYPSKPQKLTNAGRASRHESCRKECLRSKGSPGGRIPLCGKERRTCARERFRPYTSSAFPPPQPWRTNWPGTEIEDRTWLAPSGLPPPPAQISRASRSAAQVTNGRPASEGQPPRPPPPPPEASGLPMIKPLPGQPTDRQCSRMIPPAGGLPANAPRGRRRSVRHVDQPEPRTASGPSFARPP
jgi:hypothetical protein